MTKVPIFASPPTLFPSFRAVLAISCSLSSTLCSYEETMRLPLKRPLRDSIKHTRF